METAQDIIEELAEIYEGIEIEYLKRED